jgi:hypothetical protein
MRAALGTLLHKNDPPGRTILTREPRLRVSQQRVSFTQNVFHPRGMPVPNQTIFIFGTKGAVDCCIPQTCMLGGKGEAHQLAERQKLARPHHRLYDYMLKGGKTGGHRSGQPRR